MRGKRVLVVDHQETNRLAALTMLAQADVVPVDAADGAAAFRTADSVRRGEPPVLALIEEALPFAGRRRTRRSGISHAPSSPHVPIVMITGDPKLARTGLRERVSPTVSRAHSPRRDVERHGARGWQRAPARRRTGEMQLAPPVDLQPAAVRACSSSRMPRTTAKSVAMLRGGRYQLDLAGERRWVERPARGDSTTSC